MESWVASIVLAIAILPLLVFSQSSCSYPSPSGSIKTSLASGYHAHVVATGLSKPRGIILDDGGNLLVVEQGRGIVSAHQIKEDNGCVSLDNPVDVTSSLSLNHGIELSTDGKTLYASNPADAYSWEYNSKSRTTSNQKLLVTNMTTEDHTTRTLLLSQKVPGMLLVSRGSTSNIDFEAASLASGHSQVKAFDLDTIKEVFDYDSDGTRLGWGLRNDVGLAEHPKSGGIYSVENSADQISRMGVDVHENNPAEELNFLGYLDRKSYSAGGNFGYPWCFSAWQVSELPANGNLSVGSQFSIDPSSASNNENRTDAYCANQNSARLVFQAHMAPLDIKFKSDGEEAWITFHGSWDRTDPVGYKLSLIAFNASGEPVDSLESMTAATDIFYNQDNSQCPEDCFRPVGLAIDSKGRIFMSSDASGEIYLVTRDQQSGGTPTASSATSSSSSSATNAAHGLKVPFDYGRAHSRRDNQDLIVGLGTGLTLILPTLLLIWYL